jgi:hypothetical protein
MEHPLDHNHDDPSNPHKGKSFILLSVLILGLLVAGGCVLWSIMLFNGVSDSAPYKMGVTKARKHVEVVKLIGSPVTDTLLGGESKSLEGKTVGELRVRLTGATKSGLLIIHGEKIGEGNKEEDWRLLKLELRVGKDNVDLLR